MHFVASSLIRSDQFSPFSVSLITGLLDLSDPRASIFTTTSPTTAGSTNTSMVPSSVSMVSIITANGSDGESSNWLRRAKLISVVSFLCFVSGLERTASCVLHLTFVTLVVQVLP